MNHRCDGRLRLRLWNCAENHGAIQRAKLKSPRAKPVLALCHRNAGSLLVG